MGKRWCENIPPEQKLYVCSQQGEGRKEGGREKVRFDTQVQWNEEALELKGVKLGYALGLMHS